MGTLRIRFCEESAELSVRWSEQPAERSETVAEGVELHLDASGRPVELSVAGLDQVRSTNAFLGPMLRCGDASTMRGKDGSQLYYLALSPGLSERAVYSGYSGTDAPPPPGESGQPDRAP